MLTTESVEIVRFLKAWPAPCGRNVRAKQRRIYIALDYDNGPDSWCGCFLVDRLTHKIYRTKGYGVAGDYCGTIESLTMRYEEQRPHEAIKPSMETICTKCGEKYGKHCGWEESPRCPNPRRLEINQPFFLNQQFSIQISEEDEMERARR